MLQLCITLKLYWSLKQLHEAHRAVIPVYIKKKLRIKDIE